MMEKPIFARPWTSIFGWRLQGSIAVFATSVKWCFSMTSEEERMEFLAGEAQASGSLGIEEIKDAEVYLRW